MKVTISIIAFFLGLNTFAKAPDERTSLCFILATQYDEITFATSGDMDGFFFMSREPKKATQIAITNVIQKDARMIGSLQWTLSRLNNGTPAFKGVDIKPLPKKSFAKSLEVPSAYDQSDALLKNKVVLKQAQDFRKVRNAFTTNFLTEYNELCTKDDLVSTAL